MSKPRRELSLTEKVQLIKESSGQSQRKLAEKFGIGKTQVQIDQANKYFLRHFFY
jgi:transcriptional regulator with XRE-family HTH domain